jgi:DNA polymerase III subunit delta
MKEFDELLKELKNKIYHPIYFLMGDESYYIDYITDYIGKHVLNDAEKTFNQLILYGKDTDIATVINSARRYPMMANYQVVIVREAQELKKIDDLIHYVEKPLKSTILVINYKYSSLDKRTKLYKSLNEHDSIFESKKLYDNQVPEWIVKYLKKDNIAIDAEASVLLTEFLGNDLGKIANELDKLMLVLPEGTKTISKLHIERNIGISKDYNNFELTKALGQKNILKANRIADYFSKNPKASPFQMTITMLFGYFSKVLTYQFLKDRSRSNVASKLGINPYFVAEYELAAKKYTAVKTAAIISYLREYDMKSKGVGNTSTSDGELLRELLYKILH